MPADGGEAVSDRPCGMPCFGPELCEDCTPKVPEGPDRRELLRHIELLEKYLAECVCSEICDTRGHVCDDAVQQVRRELAMEMRRA